MTNYVQKIIDMIDQEMGGSEPGLHDLYALLVLTTGVNTTLEHVHDARSLWMNNIKPDHRSIKAFNELTLDKQMMDTAFRNAIVRVSTVMFSGVPLDRSLGIVCSRCDKMTGNNTQGHYWAICSVTKKKENFHFCCPNDCELFNPDGSPRPVTITDNIDHPEVPGDA